MLIGKTLVHFLKVRMITGSREENLEEIKTPIFVFFVFVCS